MRKRIIGDTVILEDQVIDILMGWLRETGWNIASHCKGSEHGVDIEAMKDGQVLIIEAKGAKGNPNNPRTVRDCFDSGQLHTHLGVAVLKVLKERLRRPQAKIAIAHPDDPYIRKVLSPIIVDFKKMDIVFYWVHHSGSVSET